MILFLLPLLFAPALAGALIDEYRRDQQHRNRPAPGLSSQRSQIKPLTPAQIALGKKAYLGPKRSRPIKRKKS